MIRCIIISAALIACVASMHAQESTTEFNKERYRINKTGFLILSSWSVANMVSGGIGLSSGGEAKYFHQMNLIWGTVNLAVALPSYLAARRSNSDLSLAASVKGQALTEKIFIFNAGLDLAYVVAGAWFLQKGNSNSNPDKYRGYGKSIMMQGGFLLLFDGVMFGTHNRHGKKLYNALSRLQLAPGYIGLNISI